ncbi:MAG: DUF1553 domain-containing protein, partial [Pirellulaceae bacterium]|nr:DUF1553 domain-containing protein [Pirellulaceae bacterium]
GERWAQHWLDVIRWAETVGFETNAERKQAWPYRNWVIESFNADKPYDQFIAEQILGDSLGVDPALGFLVSGPANLPGQVGRDEEAMRQARQDELDEVIGTFSQSVLGLTVGCARCHNHKFDPILQKDYYAMQAVFAGLQYGNRRWRGEENDRWAAQIPAIRADLDQLLRRLETLRQKHDLRPPLQSPQSELFDAVATTAIRMEIVATTNNQPASLYELQAWTTPSSEDTRNVALAQAGSTPSASSFALANQTRHFDNLVDGSVDRRQAFPWVAATAGPAWVQVDFAKIETIDRIVWESGSSVPADYKILVRATDTDQWVTVASTSDRLPQISDTRKADQIRLSKLSASDVSAIAKCIEQVRNTQSKLNRFSTGPQLYAASFSGTPPETWQLRRGDPMQRIAVVAPSTPTVLGGLDLSVDEPELHRRQALVAQTMRPNHPLTARVIVNRIWQQHFGTGLVDTPSDFGLMGSRPTHPELLDWLATELVSHDWSIKPIHRLIVTSRTFRQDSRPNDEAIAIDANSRLLWRFPPRRMEAEAIRDSILVTSGNLNLSAGGRGFDFFRQRGGLSDYTAKETFDPAGWRRMIYAHKIRMQSVDIFGTFDCPDAGQMKPKRTRSITPIQSLSLFNSPFVLRQASFFADRVRRESGTDPRNQIDHAFQLAYSRPVSDHERQQLVSLVREHGLQQLCRVLLNSSEFLYIR